MRARNGRIAIASLLVLHGACGRLHFDPQQDAGSDALGPFGPPVVVTELSDPTANDDDPTLTADMLEIYFNSQRGAGGDIWRATRASVTAPWTPPEIVTELSSGFDETTPEIEPDGLTIWFASARPGGPGDLDIYVATRSSRSAAWQTPVLVPELSTAGKDFGAVVVRGTVVLFHTPARSGAGGTDLFAATRAARSEPFGDPVLLAELVTISDEQSAFANDDLLTVYFTSNRSGEQDIYVATRASESEPFGTAEALGEINTPSVDDDAWVSPDGRTIYFASRRDGMQADILVATR